MQFVRSVWRHIVPTMKTTEDTSISSQESITIHFYWGIESKQLLTNGSVDLTCEKALEMCIEHIKSKVLVAAKQEQVCVPKYLPTFGLVICPDEKVWLPLSHVFKKRSEKQRIYKFRVRFRPPVEQFTDNITCEYLFIQTLDDFLKGPLGKSSELESRTLFRLLQIALMIPKTLPLDSAQPVDEKFKTSSLKFWNFTRYFSKEIASKFITQKIIDHYWVCQTIRQEIQKLKMHDSPAPLGFYKKEFYKMLMEALRGYRFEEYKAESISGEKDETVTVYVFQENHKSDSLYHGENFQCHLSEIYNIKLDKPKDMENKKWLVHIFVWDKPGPQMILQFTEEGEAESFISMIQGYFSLRVRYNECLCRDLQTEGLRITNDLRSFGPLSRHTAESYLEHSKSVTDPNTGGFLISESMSLCGQYDVVCRSKTETCQGQTGSQRQQCRIGIVRCLEDVQLRLTSDGQDFTFDSCLELRRDLTKKFGPQVFPKNFPRVAEINEDFQMEIEYYGSHTNTSETQVSSSSLPLPIIKEDLTDKTHLPDKNPLVRKYEVYYKTERMMLVELQSEQGQYAKSFREGLEKLYKLHRIKPSNFLKFYNMVLDAQLSVLMEYVPHGDLLTYVCGNSLKVVQKVHIMDQIVRILSFTESAKIYHGNLRLRKFMVFDSQDAGFVTVKLGDPGISSHLDTLPLDHPENIERIPWLAPERRKNLEKITIESEIYSVATTLCEILYRSDQFHKELNLREDESLLDYLTDKEHLPKPPFIGDRSPSSSNLPDEGTTSDLPGERGAPDVPEIGATGGLSDAGATSSDPAEGATNSVPDEGASLLPEANTVFEEIWNVILECWAVNEAERPMVSNLLESMRDIKDKASTITADTVCDQLKEVLYDIIPEKEAKKDTRQLNFEQLKIKFHSFLGKRNIRDTCLNMLDYKYKLGEGHFGAVWKGLARPPQKVLPPQNVNAKGKKEPETENWTPVAVKRIKRVTGVDLANTYKEVIVSCELDHPNIVKILHLCYTMSHPPRETVVCSRSNKSKSCEVQYDPVMLVMEFMNEGSLSSYAKKLGDLTDLKQISHMLKICLDVVKGMVYLSGKSIVHRDLAARNILLSRCTDGSVIAKVSDFGLARTMEANYRFYQISPRDSLPFRWMPPECLVQDGPSIKFTSQGDVWSFGVVMWEAFSKGETPKILIPDSMTPEELLEKYKKSWRLTSDQVMKQPMRALMEKCWDFEPLKRPPFVELEQMLSRLL